MRKTPPVPPIKVTTSLDFHGISDMQLNKLLQNYKRPADLKALVCAYQGLRNQHDVQTQAVFKMLDLIREHLPEQLDKLSQPTLYDSIIRLCQFVREIQNNLRACETVSTRHRKMMEIAETNLKEAQLEIAKLKGIIKSHEADAKFHEKEIREMENEYVNRCNHYMLTEEQYRIVLWSIVAALVVTIFAIGGL